MARRFVDGVTRIAPICSSVGQHACNRSITLCMRLR